MRNRITLKLTAGFIIIILLSMLTIGMFFIQMFRQYSFDSREHTMLERARSISVVMSEYSQNGGFMRGMGGFMRFLDTMSEARVWITDREGKPVQISGMGMMHGNISSSEPLPLESQEVIQDVLTGKESVSKSFSSVYNEATLTVGVPIKNASDNVIGTVLLHAPVTGITETVNKAVQILLISLLASLLLALGLGMFYSLLFTRPLKAMNQTALEMVQGNYTARTGIHRSDEIGQLGNSLDLLASKLGFTIDQLFQEKGKLHDIISSISEGIFALDAKMQPVSSNQALAGVMSRNKPYSFELLIQDLSNLDIYTDCRKVMSDGKPYSLVKDWMEKKLRFTIAPIMDNKGAATGCVALVQDISESERLEQLRRDFVANVSHEFRTPLTVIRGSLEAIVDGAVHQPADVMRYHQRMLSETRGLERLVGDLLELSRLQSGKITLNIEKVTISSLIADTVKSLQTIADKKSIKISLNSSGQNSVVLGDYDRLRQLFVIFLDNAIKYSPDRTAISVYIHTTDCLKINICDQGIGIPSEELPYIWDRFYKADKSRGGSGTGLGLAIARHIIELHEGKVSVESQPGSGTTITLTFPIINKDGVLDLKVSS